MKIVKIIGLFSLFCLSFFYTEKVINLSVNQDEIMITIKDTAKKSIINPTNALISNDYIIPGSTGKYIDVDASYKAMKKIGYYEPTLLIYKTIYPEISIYNNYNKYIIKGNTSHKNISLIYILNNTNTLDNILNTLNTYNLKITFFVDSNFLGNNINIIDKINDNEIYNYGNQGKYTKDNLIITNNIINNKAKNKAIFCLFLNKNKDSLDNCTNNKMHAILPITINYFNIKDKLTNGGIYLIDNTKELNGIIEYALGKGYSIIPLQELIKE